MSKCPKCNSKRYKEFQGKKKCFKCGFINLDNNELINELNKNYYSKNGRI